MARARCDELWWCHETSMQSRTSILILSGLSLDQARNFLIVACADRVKVLIGYRVARRSIAVTSFAA